MSGTTTEVSSWALVRATWRLCLLLLWAGWWGGLCFYAVIVVPIGTDVLGSVEQGFITQRVTQAHNVITGIFWLCLMFEAIRTRSRALWLFVVILAITEVALITGHAYLTSLMDFQHQTVPSGFYSKHAIYLWITAVEWGLGIVLPIWLFPVADSKAASQP